MLIVSASIKAEYPRITIEESSEKSAKKLIEYLQKIEDGFCGWSLLTSGIRVDSGKHCNNLLGASLAKAVCSKNDKDAFKDSKCKINSDGVYQNDDVNIVGGSGERVEWSSFDKNKDPTKAIAFVIQQRGAEQVCKFIDSFSFLIGFSKSHCISNINNK